MPKTLKPQTVKPQSVKTGIIQQRFTNNRDENLSLSKKNIRELAAKGAELILLSELHTNLYFCQIEDAKLFSLAETIPGETTQELGALAKELNVVIVSSIFEKRALGVYHNTAVVFEKDGSIAGCYRKMHIPDDPGFYEKFYFTPGDYGFKPIATSVGKLGILVCWDQWFPEAARLMALAGAEILLYPTAIGWGSQESDAAEKIRQRDAWMLIQRSHAIANGLPVLVANRTGFEASVANSAQGINFWGTSFVAGPQGEILEEASVDQSENLLATLNFARTEQVRHGWPFFRDRRIDEYQGLLKRYID